MNRKTQVIDADSWHGKIYLRVLAMIDIFIGQSSESKHYAFKRYSDYFGRRTSFCHYWRMIAVYSWLVPLCYIATAAMVVNAFIIFPIQHFGWFGPLWLIGIPLAGCAIVCGCIILFVMVIEAVDDLTQDVPGALMDQAKGFALGTVPKEGLSFFQVLVGRLIALKYGVCPIIEIKRSEPKEVA